MSTNELFFSITVKKGSIKQVLNSLIKKYYFKTTAFICGLEQRAIIKKYYKNGILIKIINSDKIKGIVKEVIYNENGTVNLEKKYKNGKPDGINKLYYLNGNIKAEINYSNGTLDGFSKIYDEKGNLKFIDYYKNGKKIKRKYKVYNSRTPCFHTGH